MLKFLPPLSNKSATKKFFKETEISPRKRNDKAPRKINRMNINFSDDQVTYWTFSLKEELQKPEEDILQNKSRFTSGQDICNSVADESTTYSTSNKSKDCAQIHCSELNGNKPGILRRFLNRFHTKETAKETKVESGKNNYKISRKENKTSGSISKKQSATSTKSSKAKIQNKQYYPQLSINPNKNKEVEESISTIEGCGTFSASNKSDNCLLAIPELNTERVEVFRKKETLDTDVTTFVEKRIQDSLENTDFVKNVSFEDSSVTVIKQFLPPEFYVCHASNSTKKDLLLLKEEHSSSELQLRSLSELETVKNSGDNFDKMLTDNNCPELLTKICSTDKIQEIIRNETQKTDVEFCIRQLSKETERTDSKERFATAYHSDSLTSMKSSSIKNKHLLKTASCKGTHSSMKIQKTDLTKIDSDENSTRGATTDDNYAERLSNYGSTEMVNKECSNEIPNSGEEFLVNKQCKEMVETDSRGFLAARSSCSVSTSQNSCDDVKNLSIKDDGEENYPPKTQLTDSAKDNKSGVCFSRNELNLQLNQPIVVSLSGNKNSFDNISEQTDNVLKSEITAQEESFLSFFTTTLKNLDQKQNVTEVSDSTLQQSGSNVEVGLYDVRIYGDVINISQTQEQNKTGNCDGDNAD